MHTRYDLEFKIELEFELHWTEVLLFGRDSIR